jgi:hypothetical protein
MTRKVLIVGASKRASQEIVLICGSVVNIENALPVTVMIRGSVIFNFLPDLSSHVAKRRFPKAQRKQSPSIQTPSCM